MAIIKDRADFDRTRFALVTDSKKAWEIATNLAVSAVRHYYEGQPKHDASWCADLMGSFLDCESKFCQTFEKFLKEATNVRLRGNVDKVNDPFTATTRGSYPANWAELVSLVEKEGLNRYYKVTARTKSTITRFNDDFERPKKASKDADVIHLGTTPFGEALKGVVGQTEGMSEEQAAASMDLVAQLAAQIEAIKAGESPSGFSTGKVIPDSIKEQVEEALTTIVGLAELNPEKACGVLKSAHNSAQASLAAAMAALSKSAA